MASYPASCLSSCPASCLASCLDSCLDSYLDRYLGSDLDSYQGSYLLSLCPPSPKSPKSPTPSGDRAEGAAAGNVLGRGSACDWPQWCSKSSSDRRDVAQTEFESF